jgi:hypothetical protein
MEKEMQNDMDESKEVEVWEFSLDNDEIDDLIDNLKGLRQTRESVHFEIDDDNYLLIHHTDNEGQEGAE